MSKLGNISEELALITKVLKQFPNGATMEQVKKASGLNLQRRTLARRLDQLVTDGTISSSGKTKGVLYHLVLVNQADVHPPVVAAVEINHEQISLSNNGKKILALVRQPIHQREPVGYNRSFLEQYQPNKTFYLTTEEREKLARVGKTTMAEQLAGTYAKVILQRLLIDLSWNSSRLEGNTYSLLDTKRLLDEGKVAEDKSATEAQMIINHKAAIEFLVQGGQGIGLNRYTILNLHAMLADNLLPDPSAVGRLRTIIVGIASTVYTPISIPQLIEEYFHLLLEKATEIKDPFEQAFFAMAHLPYLQPFDDVNKRVSRLAANIPFIQNNLAPLSFTDVPTDLYFSGLLGVYELNRFELLKDIFIWAYERSAKQYSVIRQSLGEPDLFRLKYREQIRALITEIVKPGIHVDMPKKINNAATSIPVEDREQFVNTVETELMSLHEGNIARYYIRPGEFLGWKVNNYIQ